MKSQRTAPSKIKSTRITDHPAIKQLIREAKPIKFDWQNSYVLDWVNTKHFREMVDQHMCLAGVHVLVFIMHGPQTSELAAWLLNEGRRHSHVQMGFIWDAEDYADYMMGIYPEYTCYLVVINETYPTTTANKRQH